MQNIELNDLLAKQGINPDCVLVLRHRPTQPELRKVLPWLAAEEPRIYNAYQQTQTPKVENQMKKSTYVASFIGHEPGKALFVGMYKRGESRPLTKSTFWKVPENIELRKFVHWEYDEKRSFVLWFDLQLTEIFSQWKGKMVIDWPPPDRSWSRWANINRFMINAILEKSVLSEKEMPPWEQLVFSWDELSVLPRNWKARLREWRGIYFIFDVSDSKGYVGSAYGRDNIYGRWLSYAKTGDGGNKKLKARDPTVFRFSILQRVSPDLDKSNVVQLEHAWMDRLHTRTHGLNT